MPPLPQSELSSPVDRISHRRPQRARLPLRRLPRRRSRRTQDKARAKDPARGYRGKPAGTQIVATCARCHSDAAFMRKFAPAQRVDQAAEYATSVHGKRLAAGDTKVATCASCHGAHGVRRVKRRAVAGVPHQRRCRLRELPRERRAHEGLHARRRRRVPTNQRADYQKSVHYDALTKQNDLSAPTCNDCHGNHGAAPPGVGAVTNVCGTCHAVFAAKFATSAHSQIFDRACVECHSNHAVLTPSDDMIGTSKGTLCATCHEDADDAGFIAAGRMRASIESLKARWPRTRTSSRARGTPAWKSATRSSRSPRRARS